MKKIKLLKAAMELPKSLKHSTVREVMLMIKKKRYCETDTKKEYVKQAVQLLRLNKLPLKEGGRIKIKDYIPVLRGNIQVLSQKIVELR